MITSQREQFFYALAILVGTIVGVGIFGLPYIALKAGFSLVFLYFITISSLVILVHLLYGEIALRTQGKHRLPGYAEKYLGAWGKRVAFLVTTLGLFGTLLAYLIVGGQFLFSLLSPFLTGSPLIYTLIFFSFGAFLIYRDIKSIAQTELVMLILFFLLIFIFGLAGFPQVKINHLGGLNLRNAFLPYGIIIFSLWGLAVIPEVKEILTQEKKKLKDVIFWALILSVITYLIFTGLVLGVSGGKTSEEAVSGLKDFFPPKIIFFTFLFGILTCFTSFLTLGLTLKKIFWYDYKIGPKKSWFLACFIPLFLFFLGFQSFLKVITLTGAIMLGVEGIIIFLIYLKARERSERKPAYSLNIPSFIIYFLILIFVLGIILEIKRLLP